MIFAVLAILAANIGILIGGVHVYKQIKAIDADYQEAKNTFAALFIPRHEGEVSPFGEITNQMAEIVAQKMGVTVQAAIRGSFGGSMKGVNKELEQIAIEESPDLAIASALPKSLKKNPLAMAGFQAVIQRILSNSGGIGGPHNGHHPQAKFNL